MASRGASSSNRPLAASASPDDLPLLNDVNISQRLELFKKKLDLCSVIYDFYDSSSFAREKQIKTKTLKEISEYLATTKNTFGSDGDGMPQAISMISVNLFRSLSSKKSQGKTNNHNIDMDISGSGEDDEPFMDPAFPHLDLVYEFLLRFVTTSEVDTKVAKVYIDQKFILSLLQLFDSEDSRERERLKTVLHRVYGRFMSHRAYIRSAINNIFYTFTYEEEVCNGISESLEILGSIINGFSLPLKNEHRTFLMRALMPLHKTKNMISFHPQLVYCVTQFVEKDDSLAAMIIKGLLRYWPVCSSPKEVLFITEVEEILDLTGPERFPEFLHPLFTQIAKSISSQHFQVAERSLFMWQNEYVVSVINKYRTDVIPLVCSALYENTQSHWNANVLELSAHVWGLCTNLDPELASKSLEAYLQRKKLSTESIGSAQSADEKNAEARLAKYGIGKRSDS